MEWAQTPPLVENFHTFYFFYLKASLTFTFIDLSLLKILPWIREILIEKTNNPSNSSASIPTSGKATGMNGLE